MTEKNTHSRFLLCLVGKCFDVYKSFGYVCKELGISQVKVGRRAFSVAGAHVWNALSADVTSAPSLFTFRKRLKLHLFPLSYPCIVL